METVSYSAIREQRPEKFFSPAESTGSVFGELSVSAECGSYIRWWSLKARSVTESRLESLVERVSLAESPAVCGL